MATKVLTIRGVPEPTLRALRAFARRNRRSLNSEVLLVLEQAALPRTGSAVREPSTEPYVPGPSSPTKAPAKLDLEALAAVCRRFHIRSLALFGSRAQGRALPSSDVDVLAEFEPGMTPGFGIITVADALGPVLGGKVDLVTRRGLSPRFLERILPTAIPLYGAG